jgi:hypothetical protein
VSNQGVRVVAVVDLLGLAGQRFPQLNLREPSMILGYLRQS